MSYRVSRARREFERQCSLTLEELHSLHRAAQDSGFAGRLLGAYYVLSFTQLEVFVKTLVEDCLAMLSVAAPALENCPDLILGYLIHKNEGLESEYRRFGNSEDEGEIIEKVARAARRVAAWSTGEPMFQNARADVFLEKRTYPSPKNIQPLFRRLGIKHIWAEVDRAGRMDGKTTLTSLNDLRTAIAHEGRVPSDFSLRDFKKRLKLMFQFVAALDRGVSHHFCSNLVERRLWDREMTPIAYVPTTIPKL